MSLLTALIARIYFILLKKVSQNKLESRLIPNFGLSEKIGKAITK